ncbi:MAG: serine/threonine protein phosphatase [Psychrilyobacter sp.]|nr:serine/threonine protein phosphatase [Psychrilyobacter sp.]
MGIMKLDMKSYNKIWVISDIHGYHDVFLRIFEKIKLGEKDILIINGDSCDRGAKSLEMYETIEKLVEDGNDIIHVFGNHEDLMVKGIEDGNLFAWYRNGGRETIRSYKKDYITLEKHLKYIKEMPVAVDLGEYFIVHGGIDPEKTIEEQIPYDMTWIRNKFIDFPLLKTDKIVVYGHTPNLDGKIHFVDKQKISIDTGSYDTGVLGAIELNSMEIIYESTDSLNLYVNQAYRKKD